MRKKQLANGFVAVLLVTICAQFSAAQSGRGRQLRIAERLEAQTSADDSMPPDARRVSGSLSENRSSVSGKTINSNKARMIYRDDTDHHPNRADKKAGWIGLGFLAFEIGVMIANGGDFWSAR